MARSSLSDLIGRVRLMIGDTGSTSAFSDDEIANALDTHRSDARYLPLRAVETIAPGGTVSYLDFYAPFGNWEADAALVDGNYAALTPDNADLLTGHWHFNTEPTQPVMLTGKTFDLYGAAADLLETWAAKLAREFDFNLAGQGFKRSQQAEAMRKQALEYRVWQRVQTVRQYV